MLLGATLPAAGSGARDVDVQPGLQVGHFAGGGSAGIAPGNTSWVPSKKLVHINEKTLLGNIGHGDRDCDIS